MGSTRIRGNRKPQLTLGTPGTDQSADVISWTIENEEADADVVTFEDAAEGGGRQFYLRGSAIQSTDTAAFWRYVWENSGEENVPYTIAPHGNAVPSESEPHFVGTLTIGPKPTIGGEASTDPKSAFTFDYEFPIDGEPTMDTGAGA
ncbi:major tail protein [Microbacterium phage PoRanda]|uniref:Major tail protein n=1 Tax=Microbacterium phage PoRanda TaxID=2743924 RepID=A0AAE7F8C2_9CAUD|nr:major tail protein [Microbacterium phage PoRanda]QKY80421.1 major tail protein [Microbacterium phage PoRanda]UVK63280.1 major tail protein [Microbacterium phage Upsilon]